LRYPILRKNRITYKPYSGFTLIELTITIVIVGILVGIVTISYSGIQTKTRDSQRLSQATIIAESLEKYYDKNGKYPDCPAITTTVEAATTTLNGIDPAALTTPRATKGTNSVICETPNTSQDAFGYVNSAGKWEIKYLEESTGTIVSVALRHGDSVASTYNLSLIAGLGGIVSRPGINTYTKYSEQSITATSSGGYSFSGWTGDCAGKAANATIIMNSDKSCTAKFKPAPPVVAVVPDVSQTTWSWTNTCGVNNAVYKYSYIIKLIDSNGEQIEFTNQPDPSSPQSITFTTDWQSYTYKLGVQTKCDNGTTDSDWSDMSIPVTPTAYDLTLIQGTGGTVSPLGTNSYNANTAPIITATAYDGYSFSNWTGSSGCNGAASHNITMNDVKTCTANFKINQPAAPTVTVLANVYKLNEITYSWNATTCPTDTTAIYQRTNYYAGNGGGTWVDIAATSYVDTNTGWTGANYRIDVQTKCSSASNASVTSEWSATGSVTYHRAVPAPDIPSFSYPDAVDTNDAGTAKDSVNFAFAPTCGPYATHEIAYDLKIGDDYKWNGDTSTGNWWNSYKGQWLSVTNFPVTSGDTVAIASPGWVVWKTGYKAQAHSTSTTQNFYVVDKGWGIRIKQRCVGLDDHRTYLNTSGVPTHTEMNPEYINANNIKLYEQVW